MSWYNAKIHNSKSDIGIPKWSAKNGIQTRNDNISLYSLAHFGLYILKQYDNGKFVGGILYDIPKGDTVANIVVKVSDVDNWCINFWKIITLTRPMYFIHGGLKFPLAWHTPPFMKKKILKNIKEIYYVIRWYIWNYSVCWTH